jgi:hypothetical protein
MQEVQVRHTDSNECKVGRRKEAKQNSVGNPLSVAFGVSCPYRDSTLADKGYDIHWPLANDDRERHAGGEKGTFETTYKNKLPMPKVK